MKARRARDEEVGTPEKRAALRKAMRDHDVVVRYELNHVYGEIRRNDVRKGTR